MQALLALALLQLCGAPAGLERAEIRKFNLLASLREGLMANNDDYPTISDPASYKPSARPVSRVNEPYRTGVFNRTKLSASSLIQNWNHSFAGRFVVVKHPEHADPGAPALDVGFSLNRNGTELSDDYREDKQGFGYREEARGNSSKPYVMQQVYEVESQSARSDPTVGLKNVYLSG